MTAILATETAPERVLSVDEQVTAKVAHHFVADSEGARLDVVLDTDTHRHLVFSNRTKLMGAVNIVTFPDHLVVTGDRGTWSFTRYGTGDMLSFFAGDGVNLPYWSQKLDRDTHTLGGRERYTPDMFREYVLEQRDNDLDWWTERLAPEQVEVIRDAYAELAGTADEHLSVEHAHEALTEFSFELADGDENYTFEITDSWEANLGTWDYHFAYVCHVVNHVANLYADLKQPPA